MKLSVIIPVYNGENYLGRCLAALADATHRPDEIIVVNDGSTDRSPTIAGQYGAKIIDLGPGGPYGPAMGRNRGAELAQGDILVFIDADVAVHTDTLGKIATQFDRHPNLSALFGSYDANPPAKGVVSRYKNLLHHHVHQTGNREATTFWAGCGAIRRDVFCSMGGFDPAYRRASIEDIELGARLRQAGHTIWLCPEIQATHLKRWTLWGMWRADIFDRAIPWSRLIHRSRQLPTDLNLNIKGRLSAATAWACLIFAVLGVFWPGMLLAVLASLIILFLVNADLYVLFARRGLRFTLAAGGLHLVYFLYSSLIFVLTGFQSKMGGR